VADRFRRPDGYEIVAADWTSKVWWVFKDGLRAKSYMCGSVEAASERLDQDIDRGRV